VLAAVDDGPAASPAIRQAEQPLPAHVLDEDASVQVAVPQPAEGAVPMRADTSAAPKATEPATTSTTECREGDASVEVAGKAVACPADIIGASKEAAAAEAAAAVVRRVAKAGPDAPLEEIADAWISGDREAVAARAAAALLRRVAKVGPSTPLEEFAKAWPCARCLMGSEESCEAEGAVSAPARLRQNPAERVSSPSRSPPGASSAKGRRRVRFNLAARTIHKITPYGEIYGLHPREFVFDRNFHMVPADGRFGFVGLSDAASRATDDQEAAGDATEQQANGAADVREAEEGPRDESEEQRRGAARRSG